MSESNEMKQNFDETIWNVGMPTLPPDASTVDYQFVKYENITNVTDTTNYKVFSTDMNAEFLPQSAMLEVEYKLTTAAGADLTDAEHTVLASNGFKIFQDAKLTLNGQEKANIQDPGMACHMGLLTESSRDYIQTVGKNAGYYIDEANDLNGNGVPDDTEVNYKPPHVDGALPIADVLDNGKYRPLSYVDKIQTRKDNVTFNNATAGSVATAIRPNPNYDSSFADKIKKTGNQRLFLPLAHIFPILNIDRIMSGIKFEVELNKVSNVASCVFGATTDVKLVISRVALWIAKYTPSFAAKSFYEKQKAAHPVVKHSFEGMGLQVLPYPDISAGSKTWQISHKFNMPTTVIIGFQDRRRQNNVKLNPLTFDLLEGKLGRIALRSNGKQIPSYAYNPLTDKHRILHDMQKITGKLNDTLDSAPINMENYSELYPLFMFDCEKSSSSAYEARTSSTLELEWTVNSDVVNNYNVYALIYSQGEVHVDHSTAETLFRLY